MLGRVRPVLLSGPGIPPRLIALLIGHPPARFAFGPFCLAVLPDPFTLGCLIVVLPCVRRCRTWEGYVWFDSGGF